MENQTAIGADHATLFVSLELSRSKWLVTSLSPGSDKMSKHTVAGGDGDALLALLRRLAAKALARAGKPVNIVSIHEAGLDGFSVHRLLERNEVASHVVDPASIAVPRRARRAKTDSIDGEMMLRTLLAWQRGEPRVCSMVVPPTPEEEDRRRISRERKVLLEERIKHVNRIKGLLASQGITSYQPLRRDRHQRLDELQTLDGRPLPTHLKSQILREIERMEMLLRQIIAVEEVRDTLVCPVGTETPAVLLMRLRGIGPEFATVLWLEGFFRHFDNRRQLAAYCGLAPSPWKSGQIDRDQGISKAGNPRLRTTAVELAWLWQRHQPDSALSRWFRERVGAERGRIRRITIVAMARKLMVALWRYVTNGVVPEGAVLRTL
ncbi:MAG TPA: IS110 family transposase [Gemmatimonadaceae bacterium]|nr:IS110 family transposase [Gemmatimonadaceae bacterium]